MPGEVVSTNLTLSAEQRYRQAMKKAQIIARRNLRAMLRGDRDDSGTPLMDLNRVCIIAEITRAFDAGRAAERANLEPVKP